MSFQPTAFQFNAFQTAIDKVNRSGVVRLWLMALTEALNKKPEPIVKKPEAALKNKSYHVKENKDGSATIDGNKVKKTPAEVVAADLKPVKPLKRAITEKDYQKIDLPTPDQTAEYLLNLLVLQSDNQVWAEGQVLNLLKEAIEIQREEDLILEAAVTMFL